MRKSGWILLLLLAGLQNACSSRTDRVQKHKTLQDQFTYFSKHVQDTFSLSVQLPVEYHDSLAHTYPVVVLLDANFYFPMLAPILHQYEKAGLLPPLILAGVGYRSWEAMDTLRQRDYLFPAALPSDEMTTPGGGQQFAKFISEEFIPQVDKKYRTHAEGRTLLGHSFGGYFALFALLDQIENNKSTYHHFVAASPTLWYHDFYLNQLANQLKEAANIDSLSIFLTAGAMEDSTWSVQPVLNLTENLNGQNIGEVSLTSEIYNSLDHMDVALVSFTEGLQSFYNQ